MALVVDRGVVAPRVINDCYWARVRLEKEAANMKSAVRHFAGDDAGALMNISSAAVVKASPNQAAAQKFLAFLVSKPAQEMLSMLDITL